MEATRQEQKVEAIARMRQMRVVRDAIEQFKRDDVVMVSERGILYWLNDEQKKAVEEFEQKSGGLVYQVILNNTEFGVLLSMLYVHKEMDYWEHDRADLSDGITFAYVQNLTDDDCSEYGTIGIANRYGGIVRIY